MTEERICWTCLGENSNLVIIPDVINDLKKEMISTNQKNILLRSNAGDEIYNEINECTLAETLEFAERNGYVTSYTYKNNLSYRVTEDAFLGDCASYVEPLAWTTAWKSKVNFIDPKLIKSMMEDVKHLEESFRNFDTYDGITSLKADISFLKTKVDEKDTRINF